MGLTICLDLITNFSRSDPSISNVFFKTYFVSILQDIFFVLTSSSHKAGFKLQSSILMNIFGLVESGAISVPLYDPATVANPNMSNVEYLHNYISGLLQGAFPHLQRWVYVFNPSLFGYLLFYLLLLFSVQIQKFVTGLFQLNKDVNSFKDHLRDFLITMQVRL